jgi:hypothetical protein
MGEAKTLLNHHSDLADPDGECARSADRARRDDFNESVARREALQRDGYRYPGDWPESGSGSRRVSDSKESSGHGSDTVPGTALLRSTLEALERLLRDYIEWENASGFTLPGKDGRRAIRDMVQGPLDNWLRCRDSKAGPNSRYLDALSNPFWMALNAWVVAGASAREQLQSSVRQLLDALGDTKQG